MGNERLFSLAERMRGVQSSPTLRLNALAQEMIQRGEDVINLTAGETDFPVSAAVRDATVKAVQEGNNRYTPSHGIPELRKAVAAWYKEQWGLEYTPKQITTTCGVKQGLFNLLLATVQPGDEVLIPAPYWVSYPEMVRIAGGTPVILPSDPADGFQLRAADVKAKLSSRSRLLLLNSPNNPTGGLYGEKELQEIAKVLEGTDVLVASDEIYGSLVFDEKKFTSFAALSADAYKRTITFNGLSKSHAMTGWRVGFAAGNESLIEAMGILQGQSATNVTSIAQHAALAALKEPPSELAKKCVNMQERRDRAVHWLKQLPELKMATPLGAFYCFPDLSAYFGRTTPKGTKILGSESLAEYLLAEAGVALVPGKPFGEDRCIRISFAKDLPSLDKGFQRIVAALHKLGR